MACQWARVIHLQKAISNISRESTRDIKNKQSRCGCRRAGPWRLQVLVALSRRATDADRGCTIVEVEDVARRLTDQYEAETEPTLA